MNDDILNMAVKLKYHLMPNAYPAFPDVPDIDIFADSLEIEQIGGDYYDFFRIGNTYASKTNTITANRPCTVVLKYRPIYKDTI